jgi:hypothetical protein
MARREQMRRVLARWRRSGVSGAEFCRREGLAPQALSYWKRALGAGRVARRPREARPVDFVPVRLVDSVAGAAASDGLEITLATGDRVVVRAGVSQELLRDALMVLRERC